jgi:glycosyltransferase involved in cell wall biosynthesis
MHPFNNAKSAFKAKQCLSCGIPVLASPVGENDHFVKHGKNGFICENTEDFYSYILRFKTMDSDEYDSFSQNALQSQHAFSISKYADGLLQYFQKIV